MTQEPLNTKTLEHYLNFKNDETGLVRIDEPIGFDGANFVIKQGSKRYGRDVSFAGEEVDFIFTNTINYYGFHFDKLIEYDKRYGSESDVEYLLKETDQLDYYVVGDVDFVTAKHDQITQFKSRVIQDTESALIKKRIDVKVDVFSIEDLDGNTAIPVTTENILIKAKPVNQVSEWESYSSATGRAITSISAGNKIRTASAVNTAQNYTLYGIENTLSYISSEFATSPSGNLNGENFTFIEAQNRLTNLSIQITDVDAEVIQKARSFFSDTVISGNGYVRLVAKIGSAYNSVDETIELWKQDLSYNNGDAETQIFTVPTSFNLDIPVLEVSKRLYIYFETNSDATFSNAPYEAVTLVSYTNSINLNNIKINASTTSTAIDSVTKGVRLVDAMKAVSSRINSNFVFSAPRFEQGGEWYDNFIFSGNMLRGRKDDDGNDVPFVITWKQIMSHIQEMNCDYEVDSKKLFVLKYDDFYTNTEIASFLMSPDASFKEYYNERFAINEYKFGYKKFDQDKDNENTIDGVHTESEFTNRNRKVENTKEIKCEFNRDPFLQENTRKKAVQETSASVSEDDQIFINDVVPLSPTAQGGFSVVLKHFINEDWNLQMLNDGTFNWSLLGFGIGSTITITTASNGGQYSVLELSNNIITLQAIGFTPTATGDIITAIEFSYTNVNYTIRTNEGFDSITGIIGADNFANLLYTPKRNTLNNWGAYLKTSTFYKPEDIKITYFKNNPTLVTQFNGGDIITENSDITQAELPDPILTPKKQTTTVFCDFSQYRQFAQNLKTQRGFVRITDNRKKVSKIYPQKSDFTWKNNVLEIDGEVKYESLITTIVRNGSVIEINETGYDTDIIADIEYSADGNYIQLFDPATRPLINETRYDLISVNGVIYSSMFELVNAIEQL